MGEKQDPSDLDAVPEYGEPLVELVDERGPDPRLGRMIGNMRLVEKIGAGGMGAVYRAEHRILKTHYAVKLLHPRFSEDADTVARFRQEAVACSRLRQENIVFVTDFGFDSELGIYIVMEFVKGATLRKLLWRGGQQTVGQLGRVGGQLCAGLAAAHRLGIVHRDLKPENLLILDDPSRLDFLKILDFGIAFSRDRERNLTREGVVLGTPAYMAPEQILNQSALIGAHTDTYAAGLVFYRALVGRSAFGGGSEFEILTRQVNEPAPPISEHAPALAGTRLEALVARMLEKAIDARPRDLLEVKAQLEDAVRELQIAGVEGAHYAPLTAGADAPAPEAGAAGPKSTLPMTQVIAQIREVSPGSEAAALLSALPVLGGLRGETLALALWGVVQQDLWTREPESEAFQVACDQAALLVQSALEGTDAARERILGAVGKVMTLLAPQQRSAVLKSLRPLSTHPRFPDDFLQAEHTGSWASLKAVMTREIHLPWKRDAPALEGAVAPAGGDLSLTQKLQQDVSLKSLGSVLSHEISLFGTKKGEEPPE